MSTSRRPLIAAVLTATFVLPMALVPAASYAQDSDCEAVAAPNGKPFGKRFGKLLGRAGLAALTGKTAAAHASAEAAGRDTVDTSRENAEAAAASAAGCERAKGESATRDASYSRPDQIPVPREIADRNKAFDDFGRVECSGCEGGRTFDSWARRFFAAETRATNLSWEARLAAMPVDTSITWQGNESLGTITARGEKQVGGFACKAFDWSLVKEEAVARRSGLVCWGKASPFSASESWVEVY